MKLSTLKIDAKMIYLVLGTFYFLTIEFANLCIFKHSESPSAS